MTASGYATKGDDNSFGWKLTRNTTYSDATKTYDTNPYNYDMVWETRSQYIAAGYACSNIQGSGPYYFIVYNYNKSVSWSGAYI